MSSEFSKDDLIFECQALGCVLVKDPQKILHTSCQKVFKMLLQDSLSTTLQSIVIRILRQHLEFGTNEETQCQIVDSPESQTISGSTTNQNMQIKPTLMHLYGAYVLKSSLHKSALLRCEAVRFLRSALNEGLSALYLCLPNLVTPLLLSSVLVSVKKTINILCIYYSNNCPALSLHCQHWVGKICIFDLVAEF